jgi:hypothetical protein
MSAKCNELTPQEADALFFPGSGGKPTKAESFCSGCPVLADCLNDAIKYRLEGFIAGTTLEDRCRMAMHYRTIVVTPLTELMERHLPERAKRKVRTVYRKFGPPIPDTLDYLDSLDGPYLEQTA